MQRPFPRNQIHKGVEVTREVCKGVILFFIHIVTCLLTFISVKTEDVPVVRVAAPVEFRFAADGVSYTWTEFLDYYDHDDIAAEMWEAAQGFAPPEPAQLSSFRSFK